MPDTIPSDFRFAAFYYPEILQALIQFKAVDWPEHTETDPHDPVVQLLRICAFVGHGSAVRLDHVARELYWPSLQLRSSAIALGALGDYRLAPPSPATVDILGDVSPSAVGAGDRLLHGSSVAGTADRGLAPLLFEYSSEDDWIATDGAEVWPLVVAGDDGDLVYTELDLATPYSWDLILGDQDGSRWIAFGNTDLMWNKIRINLDSGLGQELTVRWEYSEDLRELAPGAVVDNLDGTLTLDVSELVGNDSPSTGLRVVVTCLRTGISEEILTESAAGVESVTTSTTLGQLSISESPADYLCSAEWIELPDLVDGTEALEHSGDVTWSLPETTERRWARTAIYPDTTIAAAPVGHWIRVRVVACGDFPTSPDFTLPSVVRSTVWTVRWEAVQGRRTVETLGESSGEARQYFTLTQAPFLSLLSLTVDGSEWARADNFLAAGPFDRVFTLLEQPDQTWEITFGDGVRGALPPLDGRIIATYRIGGAANGNVGPGAITRDRTGNRLAAVRNPRAAAGWVAAEGSTPASLDVVRQAAPASMRILGRAVTPADCEDLAVRYRTASAEQIAIRALAVEEGAGPKTVALYLVGPGGIAPRPESVAELEAYFNGALIGLQRVGGVRPANTAISAAPYTPRVIDVTYAADVLAPYASDAQARIAASLQAALQPTARALVLDATGVWVLSDAYQWGWGSTVSLGVLIARIVTAISGVVSLTVTLPAANILLDPGELPVAGTISGTITSVLV